MQPLPGFVGPAYQHRSVNVAAERLINLYPEKIETPGAKARYALLRTPGMKWFSARAYFMAQNRPLGLFTTSTGRMFQVAGPELVEVAPGGGTGRGILLTTTGAVGMADNGTILLIVDGVNYYTLNLLTNAFAVVSDAALTTGASHVVFLDGYFALNDAGTNRWRVSPHLWNGTDAWDSLEFEESAGSTGPISGILRVDGHIWIFRPTSYEIWYHAGGLDFPFSFVPGSLSDVGTAARFSLAVGNKSALWLGGSKEGDGQVLMSNGSQAVRVSTHAVEADIASFADRSDAIGFIDYQEGHTFYVLTFPNGDRTWVYDLSTGFWHQRAFRDPLTGLLGRHLAIGCARYQGKSYCIPYAGLYSDVCEWDLGTYFDETYSGGAVVQRPIKWLRAGPHVGANLKRVTLNRFELDAERGVGLATGQGSDPQVMLRVSKDGGHTWGAERWKSMGAMGKYQTRIGWDRLGTARDWVFEVSGTDPVRVAMTGAYIDAEVES